MLRLRLSADDDGDDPGGSQHHQHSGALSSILTLPSLAATASNPPYGSPALKQLEEAILNSNEA
jgi:hypothetical protein